MQRYIPNFVLWILCVDDKAFDVLSSLDLPCVRLLRLSDFETKELLSVKKDRSIGEYCWTLTPFAPRFVFEADNSVKRVTYLDADLWFLQNPKQIFEEFEASGKHVLITDHAYSPEYDQSATSGQFCVQFMIFNRYCGEPVRSWWEKCCLEWCFSRFEDGKFGDQKYLDDWPDRFGHIVHVLRASHLTLAPWNASRFPYSCGVFFHFHGFRLISNHHVSIGNYYLPFVLRHYVYKPYLQDISLAVDQLAFFELSTVQKRIVFPSLTVFLDKLRLFKFFLRSLFAPSQMRIR